MPFAIESLLVLLPVALSIKPLGCYMTRVYSGHAGWAQLALGWLERLIYRIGRIDPAEEMHWRDYLLALLSFGLFGFLLLFVVLSLQSYLPLNPQAFPGLAPDLAFNASVSFITNTNWQSYSGESQLSYLAQAVGVTVQQFFSAATGMAVAVALCRGLSRKQVKTIGNFWADLVRGMLYILLPLAAVFALLLVSQGVVQTFTPYASYHPVESLSAAQSTPQIALGPVASQTAIEMLGSNGGGYFNANGAHPFQNPTPFSNLLEIISILLLPAAFAYTFGALAGDRRQGWMIIAAMAIIFVPLMVLAVHSEGQGNPRFEAAVIDQSAGNMEGKEIRFGAGNSALWAAATAATSNGSANSAHDSFTPLGGLVPLLLIQFGEVIFGGVGSGVYGMLMFVLLTVFIGGLMVGRTPEYLGKKLGPFEIKMASLVILVPAMLVLGGTAVSIATEAGRAGIQNPGAQGFSEVLYAFSSAANNNGSAFAGLNANTPFYNILLGVCMFLGRYWIIVPVLAIAGSLAAKNTVPVSAGTLPTHTPLFTAMLVGVVLIIGVLTYVPALALGPMAEHLHLYYPTTLMRDR